MKGNAPLLIGISARLYFPGQQGKLSGVFTKTLHYLEQSVAHWVLSGPALPVMIPALSTDKAELRTELRLIDYAAALDGLVLQGGSDVAPEFYGQEPLRAEWAGDPVRDRYEIELVEAFVQAGKPVFGICRGMQLINVMNGGSLYQDVLTQLPGALEHQRPELYEHHYHTIALEPEGQLARLYPGVSRAVTNSIHHQAVRVLAPGFVVEARCADDGVIEAIRRPGGSFLAGVQWHPEFQGAGDAATFDDAPMLRAFLDACRAARR